MSDQNQQYTEVGNFGSRGAQRLKASPRFWEFIDRVYGGDPNLGTDEEFNLLFRLDQENPKASVNEILKIFRQRLRKKR